MGSSIDNFALYQNMHKGRKYKIKNNRTLDGSDIELTSLIY